MKSIKTFVAVIALAASFGTFAAQTVTATASTMDGAEAKIAAQAQAAGASSYKITEAFTGNRVHMTAELNKYAKSTCRKSAPEALFLFLLKIPTHHSLLKTKLCVDVHIFALS